MDTRYELLSEDDVTQEGDIIIYDSGYEYPIPNGSFNSDLEVKFLIGWCDWVLAVLRPPTN